MALDQRAEARVAIQGGSLPGAVTPEAGIAAKPAPEQLEGGTITWHSKPWLGSSTEMQLSIPGDQRDVSISGNLIAFESGGQFPLNYDIFLYDLSTDTPFRTMPGDPHGLGPRPLTIGLSQFKGRDVRLRITEVDNQFFFQAGVDAVRVVQGGGAGAAAGARTTKVRLGERKTWPAPVVGAYVR